MAAEYSDYRKVIRQEMLGLIEDAMNEFDKDGSADVVIPHEDSWGPFEKNSEVDYYVHHWVERINDKLECLIENDSKFSSISVSVEYELQKSVAGEPPAYFITIRWSYELPPNPFERVLDELYREGERGQKENDQIAYDNWISDKQDGLFD